MSNSIKSVLSSVLSAAVISSSAVGTLVSCGETQESSAPEAYISETTVAEEIVTEGETTENFDPGLPEQDYNGGSFTILTKGVSAYNEWG